MRVQVREGHVGPSICVATPTYDGQCSAPFVDSMLRLQKVCERLGIALHWLRVVRMPVDRARDHLVAEFRRRPRLGDVLVFIDADEGFPPRAAFDVVRLAQTRDMVAAAVPSRAIGWRGVWRAAHAIREDDAEAVLPLVSSAERAVVPLRPARIGDVFECDDVGTGFLAVHRRVFDRLEAAHPDLRCEFTERVVVPGVSFFLPMIQNGKRLSEDGSFVARWRALGGRCWAIAWHNLVHSGMVDQVDDALVRAKLRVPLSGV